MAHRQLPSNFAIAFEERAAQPRPRATETKTKANRSSRVVLLEAPRNGGKLARQVKAAHMNNFQSVLILAKEARVMSTWNGGSINPKASHCRS